MKILLAVVLLITWLHSFAQNTRIPVREYNYRDTKATITTNQNIKIHIEQIALIGYEVRFIRDEKKMQGTINGDSLNIISLSDVKKIKIKKDAFFGGAAVGVVPGFLLGYGVGYAAYDDRTHLTDERNKERRKEKGLLYGLIGAVPTGIVGGIFSSVFTKRTYRINGDRSKMERLFDKRL